MERIPSPEYRYRRTCVNGNPDLPKFNHLLTIIYLFPGFRENSLISVGVSFVTNRQTERQTHYLCVNNLQYTVGKTTS